MKYILSMMLTSVAFSLCAASDDTTIEHGCYPTKDPYLFVSTIHHPLSLPSADHLACVARDFNHGVLIGFFQFRGTDEWKEQVHDWGVRADALLKAINTDRLYDMVRDRWESKENIEPRYGEIPSLQQALCHALSQCATNCERVLFQEEYREANGKQEAFAPQLALRRAQGCAVGARLVVGMKCLDEECIVNCHLGTTETSFFACNATDVWYYKQRLLCYAGPCEPKMLATGILVPDIWGEKVYKILINNVDIATRTLALIAVRQQWMQNEISNPTIMSVNVEELRKAIVQKRS